MIKVSVIVPVYNAEEYLEECIDSLINQDLKEIEIILIDDGSTDSSGKICDAYAKRDKRIIVKHISNSGVCIARNIGIELARGEYLGFVDSDDYISSVMYSEMYQCAVDFNVDFVMCDFYRNQNGLLAEKTADLSGGLYQREQIISTIFPKLIANNGFEIGVFNSQCFCLIRKRLISDNGIFYDSEIKYAEDTLVASSVIYHSQSFYYFKNKYYYYYRYHGDSRSRRYKADGWDNYCLLNSKFRENFGEAEFDFSSQFQEHIIYWAMIALSETKFFSGSGRDKLNKIREIMKSSLLREAFKHYSFNEIYRMRISWKKKVLFYLIKYRYSFLWLLLEKIVG